MTGLLLSNQNASNNVPFPTKVPPSNESDSLLLSPAVCFHTPGNYIQGWNLYLVILIWYGVSILAELGRCCYRSRKKHRRWVKRSRWLELDEGGQSEEDDATSFGQLVPIILVGLTAFTFLSILSGKSLCRPSHSYLSVRWLTPD
ncbi:hypothetical protein CTAM01_12289 [Colletotrichum tamarilloi]|uniref:Uncharacterized protein n=1 Tax=Colletotrichum tamarilloi TaxID=1209934 RepID=A0ABQ9QV70_9PEZI|nr:uncharacterized protein CTAM01_12289 [Colletotrichum tamarilloi]KAK1486238.1 hypothetical protein CTAM01_12289 [Colletotrichum tamarilloi]